MHTAMAGMMVCMPPLNLNGTPDFERGLQRDMKQRGIPTKFDAIQHASCEAVARTGGGDYNYRGWLGLGLRAPLAQAAFRERG